MKKIFNIWLFIIGIIILLVIGLFLFYPKPKPEKRIHNDIIDENINTITSNNQTHETTELLDKIYSDLEKEFQIILIDYNGAINPERYNEIENIILDLENKDYNSERMNNLKNKFNQIPTPEKTINTQNQNTEENNQTETLCQNNKNPVFTNHITDISKIISIQTPPMLVAGHLKTHSYIETNKKRVPIYAPTDMKLISGAYYIEENQKYYLLDFQISCEIFLRFDHIREPVDKITTVFSNTPAEDTRSQDINQTINFNAGELLGYTTGTPLAGNWDFGVFDYSVRNRFANDNDWNYSLIYISAVCPYKYFVTELKTEYINKYNLLNHTGGSAYGDSFCK